ncbi:hypothetical protein HNQ60_005188 [Povalibacter uvarum]|uniref:Uncharacterized protein n=1 Tax=Povalibacter uvarum TaxID=732238 RepID=A0A841HTN9_9GAMM|nr:hypothetical protein [Povalibacter uvarum]MBB6096266.1 hypothetical protein [Povalibacter uvarum]
MTHRIRRITVYRLLGIFLLAMLVGCQREPAHVATRQPLAGPPDRGLVLRVLLANLRIPLSSHASCKDIGTLPSDTTVGDYIAGFMAEQTTGQNSITTECPARTGHGYQCEVYLKHSDGDDEWGWGVGFEIAEDATLVPGSMRCLGAG